MAKDKTKIAVKVFDDYAKLYQDKYMNVDLYKESFNLFCNLINNINASILDIACGPGNITQHLLNKNSNYKILGVDLSINMLDLARKNNPSAEFKLIDCRNISKLNKKFDAIMCGFCLPYLSKDESLKLILDASILLNENGVLYISTMEDDYTKSSYKKSSSGKDELFMYFHESSYLVEALEKYNFSIIDISRKIYDINEESTTDLIIISQLKN